MLIIKQCLKLLNTLLKQRNNQTMFFGGCSFEIFRAVIPFNAIQMVDKPAFRQWPAVYLFPDKNVLIYISSLRAFVASSHQNVAISSCPPTLPACVILSQMKLPIAFLTILRCFMFKLATVRTRIVVSFPALLLMPNIRTFLRANKLLTWDLLSGKVYRRPSNISYS